MFDHVSIGVRNFEKAATFYDAIFAVLGYERCLEDGSIGWGPHQKCFFEIIDISEKTGPEQRLPGPGTHFCFSAQARTQVEAFYRVALKNGAQCRGAPGWRTYTKDYYACYVSDPEGHHLEAVAYVDPDEGD